MKILIIGFGGREHILAEMYAKSNRVKKVFVAPGNDLMPETNKKIKNISEIGVFDFEKIISFSKKEEIDLVDVASDEPLGAGLVDILMKEGIKTFGPNKNAAEIEWNKAWAREFMKKNKLPIPYFKIFSTTQEAIDHINKKNMPLLFIKAAGLAAGKGVLRADTKEEAIQAINEMKNFGEAGKTFVIEHGMVGEEFSLFAICDGNSYQVLSTARDHKTLLTGDEGPNTGGMGCITPSTIISKPVLKKIQKTILDPFIEAMIKENRPYTGILYLGGMITSKGPEIIEFNSRWGDPEAEVILSGITSDYTSLISTVLTGKLKNAKIQHDGKIRISIAGCAKGYPFDYSKAKDKKIYGIEKILANKNIKIYGSGIKRVGKNYVVNGGRIFHLVAEGKNISEAREKAYTAMSSIYVEGNNLQYRTDIGWRELEREVR